MNIYLTILLCFSLQISLIFSAPLEIDLKLQSINDPQADSNTLSISNLKQEVLTLNTCVKNPDQCFDLVYNTASFHIWITNRRRRGISSRIYNNTFTNTYKQNKWINYIMGPAGYLSTDTVILGNSHQEIYMNFMVANTTGFDVKGADGIIGGIIGFGRDFAAEAINHFHSEKNNSILDKLKENGKIVKKMFSQKFTNYDKTEAKLFLGDLHEDFVKNANVTSCGVVNEHAWLANDKVADMWTCRLSHVILGDNKAKNFEKNAIPINSIAVFDSTANYILAPQSEIGPFKNYFEERNCTLAKYPTQGINVFLCDNPEYKDLVDISFVLNGTAYNIPHSEMFLPAFNSSIAKIFFVENLDHWVLGLNFMKNLHILFDAENNLVSFSALDGRYVSDVSSFTTDEDYVLRGYYLFIFLFVFVAMSAAFVILLFRLKEKSVEVKSSLIDNSSFPLREAQKSINTI